MKIVYPLHGDYILVSSWYIYPNVTLNFRIGSQIYRPLFTLCMWTLAKRVHLGDSDE